MSQERRSNRVVAGVKSGARALKEIFLEKLGEKIFVDVEPFLKELYEKGKQLKLLATRKYLRRMMGADFENRVFAYRQEIGLIQNEERKNVGILAEIKRELHAAKKRGEEAEEAWRVWPEFVAWVKSNALESFDPERNRNWKYGNQVNNFLAIVLPTQVERHSQIEFLCLYMGVDAPVEETRANVSSSLDGIDDFLFDREDEIKRKEQDPPKVAEGASNLERIASKTRFQVELERDRRMLREARRCQDLLKPWIRGRAEEEEEAGEHRPDDSDSTATDKLFHALPLPDSGKYLAELEELLREATRSSAPHLKALAELVEAASELVPTAKKAGVDVLGIMKQAAMLAEKKDAKGMRAVAPALRALHKLHAPKALLAAKAAR